MVYPISYNINDDLHLPKASDFLSAFNQGKKFTQSFQEDSLLKRIGQGDQSALPQLYSVNPDVAVKVHEFLNEQNKQKEADAGRKAEGAYLIANDPNNKGLQDAVAAGADPSHLALADTRRARQGAVNLKTLQSAVAFGSELIGHVTDQASLDIAREKYRNMMNAANIDTSYMDSDPRYQTYSPEGVASLKADGQTANQQLTTAISQQNANTGTARAGEQVRHDKTTEGIGQQNADTNTGRLGETTTHDRATESIGQTNATTNQGRLGETTTHNRATEAQAAANAAARNHHHGGTPPVGKTIVARGKAPNGRPVVKYSDGTVGYAD